MILTALGLLAGAVSAVGPVSSGAGTQLLVAAAIGAGMPLPEPGWQRALFFLAGGAWLIALRLALPTPGALAHDFRFDGERVAVADVYDAIAELLAAAGGEQAGARRAALTAALDHAQDALAGPRLRRYASSSAERRLRAQYAAALPLAEAATALAWAGDALPARTAEGPRRLAVAVRTGEPCGPLPAPARSVPGLRALDDALLHAAETFDRGGKQIGGKNPGSRRIDGEKTHSGAALHSNAGTNPSTAAPARPRTRACVCAPSAPRPCSARSPARAAVSTASASPSATAPARPSRRPCTTCTGTGCRPPPSSL